MSAGSTSHELEPGVRLAGTARGALRIVTFTAIALLGVCGTWLLIDTVMTMLASGASSEVEVRGADMNGWIVVAVIAIGIPWGIWAMLRDLRGVTLLGMRDEPGSLELVGVAAGARGITATVRDGSRVTLRLVRQGSTARGTVATFGVALTDGETTTVWPVKIAKHGFDIDPLLLAMSGHGIVAAVDERLAGRSAAIAGAHTSFQDAGA